VAQLRKLPALRFSEHFLDQNHRHNIDEHDVIDAIASRRIYVSGLYRRKADGKPRRMMLAKSESSYITIFCEPAAEFWWIISARPSNDIEIARARAYNVGGDAR
jgi:uncharacterized DUF497 family protein